MNCGSNTSNHTQMVASNGAFSLIDKFTRMTNTPQTIIDRIITNETTNIMYSTIFYYSDMGHFRKDYFNAGLQIFRLNS